MSEFFQWFIGSGVVIQLLAFAFFFGTVYQDVKDIRRTVGTLPCLDPKNNICREGKKK